MIGNIRTMNAPADHGNLPFVTRAIGQQRHPALVDGSEALSYAELLTRSGRAASTLLSGRPDLSEDRVAFLVPPSLDHVVAQWGIWRAGGVAVPLAVSHPAVEIAATVRDARPGSLVVHPSLLDRLAGVDPAVTVITTDSLEAAPPHPDLPVVDPSRPALMVYTSGTTGKPKGAVITHANLNAQVASLHRAWEWTPDDRILLTLPLHHIHGIVNVLACALWSGATCDMLPHFDAHTVWERLGAGNCTLFMAVPTIYRRLIDSWNAAPPPVRQRWSDGAARCRLMVSGSAALPVATLEAWRNLTGHTLLERYGMTEIGMALANPLHGKRRPGTVGVPLPGVEVRRRDEAGDEPDPDAPAEVQVRGPGVFREYWDRPVETRDAFTDDGWFRTGDIAVVEDGYYRLLGRSSVDIIKTGGYKVSALEIEETLREHTAVRECAVVGVADDTWGERICVAVETTKTDLTLDDLVAFARERLAPYKLPRALVVVPELPRNAMGKVTKPDVARLFGGSGP